MNGQKNRGGKATVTSLNDFRERQTAVKFSIPSATDKTESDQLTAGKVYSELDCSLSGHNNNTGADSHDTDSYDDDPVKFTPHHLQSLTSFFNEGKDKGVFYSFDLDEKYHASRFFIHGVKDNTPFRIVFMKLCHTGQPSAFVGDIDQDTVCYEPYAIIKGILNTQTEARKRFFG